MSLMRAETGDREMVAAPITWAGDTLVPPCRHIKFSNYAGSRLHRNIVLHLHDPLSYSYTSRLVSSDVPRVSYADGGETDRWADHPPSFTSLDLVQVHGLFKRRPPFAEDPGRRGLGTLARTCVSMRETVFPVLFSRLVVGDYRVLQALTAGAAEDHAEESGHRIDSMKTSLKPSWSRGREGDRSAAAARRACDHVK